MNFYAYFDKINNEIKIKIIFFILYYIIYVLPNTYLCIVYSMHIMYIIFTYFVSEKELFLNP